MNQSINQSINQSHYHATDRTSYDIQDIHTMIQTTYARRSEAEQRGADDVTPSQPGSQAGVASQLSGLSRPGQRAQLMS